MLAAFLPFLVIPTVIGSAVTLLLVNIFPARRTRDILSVIAVLAAGGIVMLFRMVRPERLARPGGISVARRLHHDSAQARRRRSCRASGCSAR